MTITYTPRGVCSNQMVVTADNGIITDAQIVGGCSGNLQGISKLVTGMKLEDAISKLEGIKCGRKDTSCPDQLSHALRELLKA